MPDFIHAGLLFIKPVIVSQNTNEFAEYIHIRIELCSGLLSTMKSAGIHLARDTLLPQLLAAMACRRCLGMGNSSICDNTLSNRSGNDRLKNRDAGVVPFAARQSKLCSTVHT
jgi:hypothetical protein